MSATLKCNGTKLDKFSDNTEMYVSALTIDEIVYAGGKYATPADTYYLFNDYQSKSGLFWWSLSPAYFSDAYDSALRVGDFGDLSLFTLDSTYSFRPSIQLASGIEIVSGGTGTQTNPYVVSVS